MVNGTVPEVTVLCVESVAGKLSRSEQGRAQTYLIWRAAMMAIPYGIIYCR
jgi:hypothetical protein